MPRSLDRRRFLQHSCVLGGSLLTCSIPLDQSGRAAPVRIDAPAVDELTVREITDNQHDIFLRPLEAPGLAVTRTGFPERHKARPWKVSGAWRCTLSHAKDRNRADIYSTLASRRTFM